MTTWLVTGVTGFLGASAALYLREHVDVVGLARSAPSLPWCPTTVSADLLDPESLRRAVEKVHPDVVLHCAGLASHSACNTQPELAMAINVAGSEALAAATPGQFVFISTDAVFSGDTGGYREFDPVSPTTVYGRTKVEAEERVLSTTDALVIRTNFFGWSPSGRRSILEFFTNALSRGEQVSGFTDYRVTSIFTGELLPRIKALSDFGHTGIIHVASSDALSKCEFALETADVFGFDRDLIEPSLSPGPARDLSLNCDLAARLLGAPLPTQREGIERAYREGSPF